VRVRILNRQSLLSIHAARLRRLVRRLAAAIGQKGPLARMAGLDIVPADDHGMTEVNRLVFGRNTATDVISLPYEAVPGEQGGPSGELFVNVQCAQRHARNDPRAMEREIAWYLAHGLHHLNGASDRTPALRARMHARERRWVREAEAEGLLRDLVAVRSRGVPGNRPTRRRKRLDRGT